MKRSAKRIAALGVLLALASVMFIVESLIPPLLPMAPYVKIGLANSVVLFVIAVFGARCVRFRVAEKRDNRVGGIAFRPALQFGRQPLRLCGHGGAVCGGIPEGQPRVREHSGGCFQQHRKDCRRCPADAGRIALYTAPVCLRVQRARGYRNRSFDDFSDKIPA